MKMLKNKHILYLFILSSVLLMLDIFLYWNYKISFAGFYTDCVVFWVWIISFCKAIKNYWKETIAKVGLGFLVLGLLLSIIPMGIPFFGLMIFATGGGAHYKTNLNDEYRFQCVNYSVIGIPHSFIVENKYFFFEQEIAENIAGWQELKNVSLVNENDEYLNIKIKHIEYGTEKETITYQKIKK